MKVLVNGCGYIGEVHIRTLRRYALARVGICDINPARLKAISAKYEVTECHASLAEGLRAGYDGVVICTPNSLHLADAELCLKAGADVMIEKPIGKSAEEGTRIGRMAGELKRVAFVAYCLRFAPPYNAIFKMIRDGKLGEIISVRASVGGKKAISDAVTDYRTKRALGGGVIADFSHEIDYATWFLGEKTAEVFCNGFTFAHSTWDVEDTADILLRTVSNKTISIHMDYLQSPFYRSIEVYGEAGTILWRDFEDLKFFSEEAGTWSSIPTAIDWDEVYRSEMEHFLRCVKDRSMPMVDPTQATEVLSIVEGCIRSMETGRPVSVV